MPPLSKFKGDAWKDLTPVPQDDGPSPVCAIAYSSEFQETMGYFRAILAKDEKSPRALEITADVIQLNSANYTAWYFRRLVLDALGSDLNAELQFVSEIGLENPKNYQIWHHRRVIVEKLNDPSQELGFTDQQIQEDSKNYHAWAHRQWTVERFALWSNEMEYVDGLLKLDVRNNSAWNHRYFVVTKNNTKAITEKLRQSEIGYALSKIRKAPNNQSPWVYLRGILKDTRINKYTDLKAQLLEFERRWVSPHVSSLLVEFYVEENTPKSMQKALELMKKLATTLDTLHSKYWNFRMASLEKK